jgi:hypothetical protein
MLCRKERAADRKRARGRPRFRTNLRVRADIPERSGWLPKQPDLVDHRHARSYEEVLSVGNREPGHPCLSHAGFRETMFGAPISGRYGFFGGTGAAHTCPRILFIDICINNRTVRHYGT